MSICVAIKYRVATKNFPANRLFGFYIPKEFTVSDLRTAISCGFWTKRAAPILFASNLWVCVVLFL